VPIASAPALRDKLASLVKRSNRAHNRPSLSWSLE
jgi:hypothetical protein